jgi:hypothetical protein
MAPLYKPPTSVVTSEMPFLALVQQADPDWARAKFWEPEYITSQRYLMANPYQRGAYNRQSNVYPVGAQYGGPDFQVNSNLKPTAGNSNPGLYSGVDDGMGWA